MKKNFIKKNLFLILFLIFAGLSFPLDIEIGKKMSFNFSDFFMTMAGFIPPIFILIGLFEVWVKRETVEKHLGKDSSALSYFWAVLMAGSSVGGIYVAFPVAYTLYQKGARLSIIFTYVGAAALVRIPMTLFEASFLGWKFTFIRLIISIPFLILSSIILEKILNKFNFKMNDSKNE